jgi:hypothetical protein
MNQTLEGGKVRQLNVHAPWKRKIHLEREKNISIKCACTLVKEKFRQLNAHAVKYSWPKSYKSIHCGINYK